MKTLNYTYDALTPYISARTLMIHYSKHYLKYVENLKNLVGDEDPLYVVKNIDKYEPSKRDDILFNAGGVLNHELYFDSMNPISNEPMDKLKDKINKTYGNYETFKEEFIKNANKMKGSGYTFLIMNQEGELEITNKNNQETPYSSNLIPIIALDLWEHAYYLDYQNNRADYIKNFFQIINFNNATELYEENIQK